jgi:Kef-type K+ transport system membrane component KefB
MDLNFFFALLGGLLVLAFVANRLVRFTGVPDAIILLATGVVIGPILHWVAYTRRVLQLDEYGMWMYLQGVL